MTQAVARTLLGEPALKAEVDALRGFNASANRTVYEDVWLGSVVHRFSSNTLFVNLLQAPGCVRTRQQQARANESGAATTIAVHSHARIKGVDLLHDAQQALETARRNLRDNIRSRRNAIHPCAFSSLATTALAPRAVACPGGGRSRKSTCWTTCQNATRGDKCVLPRWLLEG